MNRKASTGNILLAGMLLLLPGVPRAFAQASASDTKAHDMSPEAKIVPGPPAEGSFKSDPVYPQPYDPEAQLRIYGAKHMIANPTGVPQVELGIRMYDRGAYTPRPTWLGAKDPIQFGFMSFGDLRLAAADYDNGITAKNGETRQSAIAARLNLDMDFALTATERFHAFTRPLDKNGSFTRYDISGGVKDKFIHNFDFNLDTFFFEGDVGAITSGLRGKPSRFDMPFAIGRMPFVAQNGVWIEDAFNGAAFTIPARNFPSLDVSNMDITFFGALDKFATDADPGDTRNKAVGFAAFADALKGYIEYGYAYVRTDNNDLSYHNATAAFTRRYKGRLSNSVRVIGNFGQKGIPGRPKTADGLLLLVENSLTPRYLPWGNQLNFVPYLNLFAGLRSPQSLARGGDAGGVLRNTGITFESDGITNYPTLDAKAHDTYGGALGLEYLFDLAHQIVIEGSAVERRSGSLLPGNEYAIGARYQQPISPDLIIRFDAMKGWRQGQKNVYGVRAELRLKF